MQPSVELPFTEAGLYLCYMNYHATGEGVSSCVAVAGSAQRAEDLIKEKLPTYFHVGLVTASIDADANDEVLRMIEWTSAGQNDFGKNSLWHRRVLLGISLQPELIAQAPDLSSPDPRAGEFIVQGALDLTTPPTFFQIAHGWSLTDEDQLQLLGCSKNQYKAWVFGSNQYGFGRRYDRTTVPHLWNLRRFATTPSDSRTR